MSKRCRATIPLETAQMQNALQEDQMSYIFYPAATGATD